MTITESVALQAFNEALRLDASEVCGCETKTLGRAHWPLDGLTVPCARHRKLYDLLRQLETPK